MKGTARPCLGLLPGLMFSLCNQQVLYRGLFTGIHDPLGLFRVTVKEKFAKAFSEELSQEINRLFRMQGTDSNQHFCPRVKPRKAGYSNNVTCT